MFLMVPFKDGLALTFFTLFLNFLIFCNFGRNLIISFHEFTFRTKLVQTHVMLIIKSQILEIKCKTIN